MMNQTIHLRIVSYNFVKRGDRLYNNPMLTHQISAITPVTVVLTLIPNR